MLVLTRKLDETIRIGEDIRVTVLRVKGNTVRIGIEAPNRIRVVREELRPLAEVAPESELTEQRVAERSLAGDAVIATVVDSPEPSGNRLFVGKVAPGRGLQDFREDGNVANEEGDQAAPLRAFLRRANVMQAVG